MRLIETVCAVMVMSFFVGICASAVQPVKRILSDTERISYKYGCDCFVAGSFRRLCEKSADKAEFDEWSAMCSAEWRLESIKVTSAGFDSDGHRVLRCVWKRRDEEKMVLAVQ